MKKEKVNLGCGYKKYKDMINVDIQPEVKPDFVVDIGKDKFPFKSNSIKYMFSEHVFEHLDQDEFGNALKECHRVLKPGGVLKLILPYCTSLSGDSEYHKFRPRYWVFKDYDDRFGQHEKTVPRFTVKRTLVWKGKKRPLNVFNKMVYYYENTFLRYLFPADEIRLEMKKQKTKRKK